MDDQGLWSRLVLTQPFYVHIILLIWKLWVIQDFQLCHQWYWPHYRSTDNGTTTVHLKPSAPLYSPVDYFNSKQKQNIPLTKHNSVMWERGTPSPINGLGPKSFSGWYIDHITSGLPPGMAPLTIFIVNDTAIRGHPLILEHGKNPSMNICGPSYDPVDASGINPIWSFKLHFYWPNGVLLTLNSKEAYPGTLAVQSGL